MAEATASKKRGVPMDSTTLENIPGEVRELAAGFSVTGTTGLHGTFAVEDPATGEEIAQLRDGTVDDATAAVDAAFAAFPAWAATSPRHRSEVLHKAFALMLA